MMHELKILPAHFEAVIRGQKKFEIRDNTDRGFQAKDIVLLREISSAGFGGSYTGREQMVEITYVTNYNQPQNQVVFGFSLVGDATGTTTHCAKRRRARIEIKRSISPGNLWYWAVILDSGHVFAISRESFGSADECIADAAGAGIDSLRVATDAG